MLHLKYLYLECFYLRLIHSSFCLIIKSVYVQCLRVWGTLKNNREEIINEISLQNI